MDSQEKKTGYFLERTTRKVKLAFIQAFKKEDIDLTPEQWVILDHLYVRKALTQKEIGDLSFKNAPTISRILDLLGKKQLLERQSFDGDRRKFKVILTKKGEAVVQKGIPIVAKLREQGWSGLSEKDYAEFQRITNQIFQNFS